ncbi:hypothetical protein TrLO_g4036 [Triparma laevis f. longispina]|uniref:Uncharacterized protein n=1 Tax=Triparma laevis f. longispina TaxID=1714387 RepID=A0A9W7AUI5_9STRA|nr:hypothetical protein TrLO_g4036 [Triparma laevis f. longispina]
MSRMATKTFHKKGGIENIVKPANSHSFYYLSLRDLKVPGFKHREWRTKVVWKKEGKDKMIVCYQDTDDLDEEYPRDRNVIAASGCTIWEYERLPEDNGIPQMRVKVISRNDVAGRVPNFVMNRLVMSVGKSVINMRKTFDRSLKIDDSRRKPNIQTNIRAMTIKTGASDLFCNLGALLYERFKKEDVIDERYRKDFIKNIDNAPTLTEDERKLISGSMKLVDEVSSKAKRIPGTVRESVEKYVYRSEEGGALVGMTVAKVDLSAFTTSVALPGGFSDRVFKSRIIWEELIDEKGRRTFIIAIAPLETYDGTHHDVSGAEHMVEATSKAAFIIKELTENTCEYTRAQ